MIMTNVLMEAFVNGNCDYRNGYVVDGDLGISKYASLDFFKALLYFGSPIT